MGRAIDFHTHTSCSDGTDTPEELMGKALARGIGTLAITDHDTVEGVKAALARVPEGLTFVPGVELSCRGRAGKCHILGLGVDVENSALTSALDTLSALRRAKLERRLRMLAGRGLKLPDREADALRALPAAGKPHVVEALVLHGPVESREAAFALLKEGDRGTDRLDARTAVAAILAAGGVPVWAHPRGGVDGAVGETEFRALLPELVSYGLRGMECWYSLYPSTLCRELSAIARENGLLVSAGSDYHGKNKNVPLGKLCADEAGPDEEDVGIFV